MVIKTKCPICGTYLVGDSAITLVVVHLGHSKEQDPNLIFADLYFHSYFHGMFSYDEN